MACARHEVRLHDGSRAGFFLGDGPGVGKGRQIAAAALHYFCQVRSQTSQMQTSPAVHRTAAYEHGGNCWTLFLLFSFAPPPSRPLPSKYHTSIAAYRHPNFLVFSQGKTKAVWLSASSDLVEDARRDLQDIGALQYEAMKLHDLRKLKVGDSFVMM